MKKNNADRKDRDILYTQCILIIRNGISAYVEKKNIYISFSRKTCLSSDVPRFANTRKRRLTETAIFIEAKRSQSHAVIEFAAIPMKIYHLAIEFAGPVARIAPVDIVFPDIAYRPSF